MAKHTMTSPLTVGAVDGDVLVGVLAPEGGGNALHLINGLPGRQHLRPEKDQGSIKKLK
jgi:hypothetical protein